MSVWLVLAVPLDAAMVKVLDCVSGMAWLAMVVVRVSVVALALVSVSELVCNGFGNGVVVACGIGLGVS
jgi:hypothetical protein